MRNYKESNNKIVADEDLIRRTIIKIKEKGEIKVPVIVWVRKVAIGAVAMLILACSGAITYATITKDARILQFFGIQSFVSTGEIRNSRPVLPQFMHLNW